MLDSHNRLWIGIFGGGLNRLSIVGKDSVKIEDCNKIADYDFGKQIIAIHETSDSTIWVGSYNGRITTFRNTKDESENYWKIESFADDIKSSNAIDITNIMDITEDKSSNIWIGTYGKGLFCYTPSSNRISHFKNNRSDPNSISEDEIQSLFVDNSGILWIGTQLGSGINKLEIGSYKFKSIPVLAEENRSLNDKIVWAICEDKNNNIWIGTHRGGVNIWNKEKYFRYLNTSNMLPDNHIRSFVEDKQGNMWIGTYSGGLSIYFRDKDSVSSISSMRITGNSMR